MRNPRTMTAEAEERYRRDAKDLVLVHSQAILRELNAEREVSRKLADALEKSRCTCKQEWEEECPGCGSRLFVVRNIPNGMLNDEQFASVRAGDFYCRTCKGTESHTGYKYFWKKDLHAKLEQCVRCAALAQYNAQSEGLASSKDPGAGAVPSQEGSR